MNPYQPAQEYNDLRWGTMMPVTVMVGSAIVQVRARGNYSVKVADSTLLAQAVPDPEELMGHLRSLVISVVTDLIGLRSTQVSDVAQLTAISAETVQSFQTSLKSRFEGVGLQLTKLSIDAIESV